MKKVQFFSDYIIESVDEELTPGKKTLEIFLSIIDNIELQFLPDNPYNHGKFFYLFRSDIITQKHKLSNILSQKKSLKNASDIYEEISEDKRLCFYIGIISDIVEYGFLDSIANETFKVGTFKITRNKEIRNISFPCLVYITKYIKKINIIYIKKLLVIKEDIHDIFEGISPTFLGIVDVDRIMIKYDINNFDHDNLDEDRLNNTISLYVEDYKWKHDVYCHSLVDDKCVMFIIKLKKPL